NMKHVNCPLPENTLTKAFYKHPAIKYLAQSSYRSKPSYINPSNFSSTMVKILRGEEYDGTHPQMNSIRATLFELERVHVGDVKNAVIGDETSAQLKQLFIDSQNDIDHFKALLEKWYNETMERTSGWYKRQTQWILIVIGFGMAIWGNVDTIAVYRTLAKDKKAREQIVQMAIEANKQYAPIVDSLRKQTKDTVETRTIQTASGDSTVTMLTRTVIQTPSDSFLVKNYNELIRQAEEAQNVMGLGWEKKNKYQSPYWFVIFIGWLITALAISLGAPFWFDLLNKIANLRSGGPKPGTTNTDVSGTANTSTVKRVG
ncbi:MAG: hypothetical protein ACXWV9_06830, partial [Flavisolibacter sp.]